MAGLGEPLDHSLIMCGRLTTQGFMGGLGEPKDHFLIIICGRLILLLIKLILNFVAHACHPTQLLPFIKPTYLIISQNNHSGSVSVAGLKR